MPKTKCQTPKTAKLSKKSFSKPPIRQPNHQLRTREYLTTQEIDKLRKGARGVGRNGHRGDTLILIMFRHGLRVSEATTLRWEQIDLKQGLLHVKRLKNGIPSTHPLRGVELCALRALQRDCPDTPYVFMSEQKSPLTNRTVHHIISRAGEKAGLEKHPITDIGKISQHSNVSIPTITRAIQHLEVLGVVKEITGKERRKIYAYKKYLDVLNNGVSERD